MSCKRLDALFLALTLLTLTSGCFEWERTIHLNQDGSGQLVEVLRFDDRLTHMARSDDNFRGLLEQLDEKHVRQRLSRYGEVSLVRHEVKDRGGKGTQATTVLAFKNINKLTLPALPHRGANWTDQNITFALGPVHEFKPNQWLPMTLRKALSISFAPATTKATAGVDDAPSPAQRQELARLLPLIRPLIDGFHVTLRLEAFGPIYREIGNKHTLFDLSASDLDDDTLIKLLEWRSAPDKSLAGTRNATIPLSAGGKERIMAGGYTLQIAPSGR